MAALIFALLCSFFSLQVTAAQSEWCAAVRDPSFQEHPYLTSEMRTRIIPYLMPLDHPAKEPLDWIFSQTRVLENEKSLLDAGFQVIAGPQPYSFAIIAKHPLIPGYVFKLYLDTETRCRKDIPNWVWLTQRCAGARGIKKVIKRNHIRLFTVPDKWLYVVPAYTMPTGPSPQHVILVATDMEPENEEVSREMWKTKITRKHLDELYLILKSGYGGYGVLSIPCNVPYTKQGNFAFTDTEDPRTPFKLKGRVKKFLSNEMRRYWDSLVNEE